MAFGDIITAGGQALQDLFGSEGATAEANSYSTAAQLAEQNASLTAASTRIQETQLARKVFQTEGTQIADVASAGFTESGSALDLLRSSAQQGALAKSLTNIQGAINENSYAAQAGAYKGAAAAAGENAQANTIGAIASLGGALVNNSQSLVSAGKTVVKGIDYVSGLFSGGEDVATTAFSGASAASDVASTAAFLNPGGDVNFAQSALDSAISGGSDLSESIASSSIGIDTSGLGIGTDLSDAFTGIGDAFSAITDSVGSALGDVATSLGLDGLGDLGLDAALGPIGLVLSVGSFIPGVSDVINTVTDAVGSAIGDVFSGIGSVFGSVICSAYFAQDFISRRVWVADKAYGNRLSAVTYRGYLFWGKPIAQQIVNHRWLAHLLFPIFKTPLYEMAAQMGIGRSTFFGRLSLKFFLSLSFLVGFILTKQEEFCDAYKART